LSEKRLAAAPDAVKKPRVVPIYVSPEQVAETLGTDVRTVLRFEKEGKFPQGLRFTARMVRYPVSAVNYWFRERDPDFGSITDVVVA